MVSALSVPSYDDIAKNSVDASNAGKKISTGTQRGLISGDTLQKNYQMFLSLLTTQLKNQNPLQPLSVEQFTQQMVQFSGIEQQLKTNEQLERLITSTTTNASTSALGYLNSDVTARNDSAALKNGAASWSLVSPSTSTLQAVVTIRNEAGQAIDQRPYTLRPGAQTFSWDGKNSNGVTQQDGNYRLAIEAKDSSNAVVNVSLHTTGRVTGVDFSAGEPVLLLGTKQVRLADVQSIRLPNNP